MYPLVPERAVDAIAPEAPSRSLKIARKPSCLWLAETTTGPFPIRRPPLGRPARSAGFLRRCSCQSPVAQCVADGTALVETLTRQSSICAVEVTGWPSAWRVAGSSKRTATALPARTSNTLEGRISFL